MMVRKRVWRVVMLIMLLVLGFCVPLKVQSQGIPGLSQSEVTMPRLGLPIYRPSWELGDTVDPTLSLMPACAADEGNHLVLSGRGGVPEDPRYLLRGTVLWRDEFSEGLEELSKETLAQLEDLNRRGQELVERGQSLAALEVWRAAEQAYAQAGIDGGVWGSRLNQIEQLRALGRYPLARQALTSILPELQALSPSPLTVQAYGLLGELLQIMAEPEQSQEVLEEGVRLAEALGDSRLVAQLQFRLANGDGHQRRLSQALERYERVMETLDSEADLGLEARLNRLRILVLRKELTEAEAALAEVEADLQRRSPSRRTSYGRINLAESLLQWDGPGYQELAVEQLSQGVREAHDLGDLRGESYGLGHLGQLYEGQEDWPAAADMTQRALSLAQSLDGRDLTVLWQWQLARILAARGERLPALALYRDTVALLSELRLDLLGLDPELQFPYRQQIEPVYHGLVRLLLQSAAEAEPEQKQANLREAQQTLISLRLSELDNFFRETCLAAEAIDLEALDESAAVFYTAILSDRLAVILSIAGESPLVYETEKPRSDVEESLELMLQSINPAVAEEDRLERSAQVYDWLIRPVQELLEEHEIKTLVFVPDGSLRNVPLGALYDRTSGEYLIEQYAIALTQSLRLLETGSLAEGEFRALLGGLSEAHQGFTAIPAVESEVRQIAELIPGTQSLLNRAFTREALVAQSRNTDFNVIHLATHGQFSSRADETFLLTWDGRIQVSDLDQVLRSPTRLNPIDLLVLSACQTATGDDRATLGIAGFALRSGARSTLATLWSVQDEPTAELMVRFYEELWRNSGQKKAESLRQAQLALLRSQEYRHPADWSPFVLVGNWL
ncbi:CHAT domain-containing protein [Phormidium yuhuli AB48]|uniref:CHAT domain-containing protein n=1 Tax=Phormidium yuhuli AB48 TaxID=2940671 RepID=A0ABY5ATQ8_9CYAN|nr:CHAT domain-containing protein [Phormidium yuhuli]USR92609.1 CHAT domain-containing protein [Phormidium yuhuli AB48]